jgi:hypothetical protein
LDPAPHHHGQTLALMICTDWIWAGLYDGKVTRR